MRNNSLSFIELAPTIMFGITYVAFDLFIAIEVLMATSLISAAIIYYYKREISWLLATSTLFLMVFGGLSLYSGNPMFIKIKPTVVYMILAIALTYDSFQNGKLVAKMFPAPYSVESKYLKLFARHSALFLTCIACANEIVWRNFSEETWVLVKSIIFPICNSIYFATYAFRLIKKSGHSI